MASASSIERSIRAGPRVERVWCRTQSGFRLVISVPGQHGPVGRTPRCGADGYAGDESPITPGTQINRVPMTFGTPLSTFATLRLFRRRVAPVRGGARAARKLARRPSVELAWRTAENGFVTVERSRP